MYAFGVCCWLHWGCSTREKDEDWSRVLCQAWRRSWGRWWWVLWHEYECFNSTIWTDDYCMAVATSSISRCVQYLFSCFYSSPFSCPSIFLQAQGWTSIIWAHCCIPSLTNFHSMAQMHLERRTTNCHNNKSRATIHMAWLTIHCSCSNMWFSL